MAAKWRKVAIRRNRRKSRKIKRLCGKKYISARDNEVYCELFMRILCPLLLALDLSDLDMKARLSNFATCLHLATSHRGYLCASFASHRKVAISCDSPQFIATSQYFNRLRRIVQCISGTINATFMLQYMNFVQTSPFHNVLAIITLLSGMQCCFVCRALVCPWLPCAAACAEALRAHWSRGTQASAEYRRPVPEQGRCTHK